MKRVAQATPIVVAAIALLIFVATLIFAPAPESLYLQLFVGSLWTFAIACLVAALIPVVWRFTMPLDSSSDTGARKRHGGKLRLLASLCVSIVMACGLVGFILWLFLDT